ncbi:ABC transporter substrate-binding protein [Microbacterium sp.]|uniref:ABC transporter substrate-binding protein n=1 Tax=Microbacterium sp. TaxID=51671 RepID=UPI003F715A35
MRHTALSAAALTGAAILVLAGCSAGEGGGSGGDEKVTITYSNFISNGGNEENLQKIVAAFEEENPDITVDVTTLPYGDYGTALQTDLAAGTAADVFDLEYAQYAQFQSSGVLAPLELSDPAVYRPSVLEAYQTDGVNYAAPTSFSTVVLYYNKRLFDEAGLDYPTDDWRWSDVQDAGEALTDTAAGVWGVHQPVSFYEFYKVLAQNGGEFLDDSGTKVAFNSPEGLEAASWLVDKSGTIMPTIEDGQGTPDFDTNLFKDGKLGMMYSGIWVFGALADMADEWDIAVDPWNTDQASALFSNAVGVNADSDKIAAATKWVEFLTSSDVMVQTRLDAGWELPPIADDAELGAYLDKGDPANRQAVFDSLDGVALPPVVEKGQQEMQDIMTEELVEAQAGRKTVEQALTDAESRINAAIG